MNERLGQLRALFHAGGIATDRPVALLVQADVTEHLGRSFAGG
jgi:hypothetical protein